METMTPVEVIVACPSCANPMSFRNDSWQCLACHPIPTNIPTCATQKCKRPLTKLPEPWNCFICLECNTHPEEVNKMRKEEDKRKRTYLDKKVTPDDVQRIVDAAVEKALAAQRPDYPPTQAEITQMTETTTVAGPTFSTTVDATPNAKPETYLQKAKRLGVATHIPDGGGMRKKVEIMADIEKAEQPTDGTCTPKQLARRKEIMALPEFTERTHKKHKNIHDEWLGTFVPKKKKEEVFLGGAYKQHEKVDKEESIEEAKEFSENAQSPPGEDDKFARGLSEKDMV